MTATNHDDSGVGGFEGSGGVRASSSSGAVYSPLAPSTKKILNVRFAWTPLGS